MKFCDKRKKKRYLWHSLNRCWFDGMSMPYVEWNVKFKSLPLEDQKRLLKEFEEKAMSGFAGYKEMPSPLDCCESAPVQECGCLPGEPMVCHSCYVNNKKMETTMRTIDKGVAQITLTTEDAQRSFLLSQLSTAYYEKSAQGRKEFKVDGPEEPKTMGELKARLKAGEYTIRTKDLDGKTISDDYKFDWERPLKYLSWWKEGEGPDKEGFEAFIKKVDDEYKTATRMITVGTPKEGLEALQKFESTTVH